MREPVMTEPEILVRLDKVSKAFGDVKVLDCLDLEVRRGENVAVLGQSGSGKSVLLKLIIGLLELDDGEIHLWGQPIRSLSEEEMGPLRRRMGFLFQSGALFDSMSVFDNVAFPLVENGYTGDDADLEGRVEQLLEWVDLPGTGSKRPSELSGGMRKRVALARTLAVRPELILYDEATTGLDPVTGRRISCLIRDTAKRLNSTSIVVTHDVDCARTVADRWTFLHGGRILADGTPSELFESRDPEVQAFLAPWAPTAGAADSANPVERMN